jgi:hypothetical protein
LFCSRGILESGILEIRKGLRSLEQDRKVSEIKLRYRAQNSAPSFLAATAKSEHDKFLSEKKKRTGHPYRYGIYLG